MRAVPDDTPVTIPVVADPGVTVATAALVEVQVRLAEVDERVAVLPTQTVLTPVIGEGRALIVMASVRRQPLDSVYEIVAAPAVPPVTVPVAEPIGAIVAELLLQVPPLVESENVSMTPEQMVGSPTMAAGRGFTETSLVVKHPVVGRR